jgi:uncharacterized protein involved in exopolysaccharide biosynthesis
MMNEQSGISQHLGTISAFGAGAALPSTGLRDLVVPRPTAQAQKHVSVSEIWRVVLKWWWLIAVIVLACVLAAFGISMMIEPVYRASTTLEVNREGIQPVQMGELQPLQMQDREFLNTQAGLLQSRQLAERVARSLNLANDPAVVSQDIAPPAREAIATQLIINSVEVAPVRESRLLSVTVEQRWRKRE